MPSNDDSERKPGACPPQIDGGETFQFTRRALLRWTGVAALAPADMLASLGPNSLTFDYDGTKVRFLVNGIERFVIDAAMFPAATLRWSQSTDSFSAVLKNALFPGTLFNVSLKMTGYRNAGLWDTTLSIPGAGINTRLTLVEWLLDHANVAGVSDGQRLCVFRSGAFSLSTASTVTFSRNWVFEWNGRYVGQLTSGPDQWVGDRVTAGFAAGPLAEGTSPPPAADSIVTLDRGTRRWSEALRLRGRRLWRLKARDGFDRLTVECSGTRGDTNHRVVFMNASPQRIAYAFLPGALTGPDGDDFSLALGEASLAFDPNELRRAIILHANIAEPAIALGDDFGVSIDSARIERCSDFQLQATDGEVASLDLHAGLSAIGVRSRPGVVQSTTIPQDTLLRVVWDSNVSAAAPVGAVLNIGEHGATCSIRGVTTSILRPRDFLTLSFNFPGFELKLGEGDPHLVQVSSATPGVIIVRFPPQHVAEQAFYEQDAHHARTSNEPPQPPPVQRRISGPSRLAFRLPDGAGRLSFTAAALLDWSTWLPHVSTAAAPRHTMVLRPQMCPAADDETAIEAPYRLQISPDATSCWDTPLTGEEEHGAAELWHAVLRPAVTDLDRSKEVPPAVRALWSPDLKGGGCDDTPEDPYRTDKDRCLDIRPGPQFPFRMSLTADNRSQIVHLTSDYRLTQWNCGPGQSSTMPFEPVPVDARLLLLSGLGASLDLAGDWDPTQLLRDAGRPPYNLLRWRHRAFLGRDNFVQILELFTAFPLGHLVALVTETERKLQPRGEDPGAPPVAYLRQRQFVVTLKQDKSFPALYEPFDGRASVFANIRIDTKETPTIDAVSELQRCEGFIPTIFGVPFLFRIKTKSRQRGVRDGECSMPLLLLPWGLSSSEVNGAAKQKYQADLDLRTISYRGQPVAWAPSTKEGETVLDTEMLRFSWQNPICEDDIATREMVCDHQPPYYPFIEQASVAIPSVQRFSGKAAKTNVALSREFLVYGFPSQPQQSAPHATAPFTLDDQKLALSALDLLREAAAHRVEESNKGEIFLESVANNAKLDFPGNHSGGIATPSIEITGLSRIAGPVAGVPSSFASGIFNAVRFFNGIAEAKLLGVIELGKLIPEVRDLQQQSNRVPKLLMEQLRGIEEGVDAIHAKIADALHTADGFLTSSAFTTALDKLQTKAGLSPTMAKRLTDVYRGLRDAEDSVSTNSGRISDELKKKIATARDAVTAADAEAASVRRQADEIVTGVQTAIEQKAVETEAIFVDTALVTLAPYARAALEVEQLIVDKAAQVTADVDAATLHAYLLAFTLVDKVTAARTELLQKLDDVRATLATLADHPVLLAWRDFTRAAADSYLDPLQTPEAISSAARLVDAVHATISDRPFDSLDTRVKTLKYDVQEKQKNLNDEIKRVQGRIQTEANRHLQEIDTTLHQAAGTLETELGNRLDSATAAVLSAIDQELQPALAFVDAVATIALDVVAAAHDAYKQYSAVVSDLENTRDEILAVLAPRDIVVTYSVEPKVQSAPAEGPIFRARPETRFVIESTVRSRVDIPGASVSKPEIDITATLQNFDIVLFPFAEFLTLKFKELRFKSRNGGAPDVGVTGLDVEFGQALEFVKALQDYLPFGNQGDGFFIDVTGSGVAVGYRLGLPSIVVGAFNIHGLSIAAAIELRFDNQPARVRFSFAESDHPFILTMGIFGGGGFLAVSLLPDRVDRLEGALEFGAFAQLDLAVAHGSAHILAGIYFSADSDGTLLTGFVHAGGELRIIGMVNMMVEFYMGLTRNGENVSGEAVVKVSIDLFLDTIDVEIHCHREFAGGGGGGKTASNRFALPDAFVAAVTTAPLGTEVFDPDPMPSDDAWCQYRLALSQKGC